MNIKELCDKALLSDASYADFKGIDLSDKDDIKTALTNSGFTSTQSDEFIKHWEVIDHQPDTSSGFSATLFKNKQTGEYVFANRGTAEIYSDVIKADLFGIVLQGKAKDQLIDMFRYFKKLETVEGQAVVYSQSELTVLSSLMNGATNSQLEDFLVGDIGIGAISNSTSVSVTGHSLGGHLSTWFPAFFGNKATHTFTFNGAGIGGFGVEIIDLLTRFFQDGEMYSLTSSDITNVYAEQGLEVTAGVGAYVGMMMPIFIEDQGLIEGNLLIANHSIAHLVDSLNVYQLMNAIDNSLSIDKMGLFLESASNIAKNSLESVINTIGDLLQVDGKAVVDDRESLYARLSKINAEIFVDPYLDSPQLKSQYQNLQIVDVAS